MNTENLVQFRKKMVKKRNSNGDSCPLVSQISDQAARASKLNHMLRHFWVTRAPTFPPCDTNKGGVSTFSFAPCYFFRFRVPLFDPPDARRTVLKRARATTASELGQIISSQRARLSLLDNLSTWKMDEKEMCIMDTPPFLHAIDSFSWCNQVKILHLDFSAIQSALEEKIGGKWFTFRPGRWRWTRRTWRCAAGCRRSVAPVRWPLPRKSSPAHTAPTTRRAIVPLSNPVQRDRGGGRKKRIENKRQSVGPCCRCDSHGTK